MKNKLHKLLSMAAIVATMSFSAKAQTISDFESLTLSKADTFWNGITNKLGTTFSNGNAIFNNYYDTSYGGFWSAGFAYTNMQDSIHGDYHHLYSSKALKGFNGSANYVSIAEDAYNNRVPIVKLSGNAAGKQVSGFYISNSTYAFNSMRDGISPPAKKFGGSTGNDPDWFKVTIYKWLGGVKTTDSVDFYLADFRFSNNAQDYIVNDWRWVDLTSLGNVDSLSFHLSSSDNSFGFMNTPAFFCMDNFTTKDAASGIEVVNIGTISVSPNPTNQSLVISHESLVKSISIFNVLGENVKNIILNENEETKTLKVDVSNLENGIYFLKTVDNSGFERTTKFIKQ